ncbi:hypothetical protein JHS3_15970 [Jeongeupia sp. HS-3]|uniref:hypothetical protein n=1 Tax=Jeongeupia sp. HS-3 TaxID=1009682 RepID=UPI0018A43D80|nr:hypothetical protein [Jeongeupia sp. HS-3]BCL75861.1 hypothetical protein JHS3_15970 [Jeongeupia sp. HS-3]
MTNSWYLGTLHSAAIRQERAQSFEDQAKGQLRKDAFLKTRALRWAHEDKLFASAPQEVWEEKNPA